MTATPADLAVLQTQLGREPRGVVDVAARCVCGNPTVVKTFPRLPDGTPFPTLYYLTHPGAVAATSQLEAVGTMREMTESLAEDEGLAEAYRAAHERYLTERYELEDVPEIHGISAGGMPERVKCLHVGPRREPAGRQGAGDVRRPLAPGPLLVRGARRGRRCVAGRHGHLSRG